MSERCALNETGYCFSTPPIRSVSLRMWQPNNSSKKRLNEEREREMVRKRDGESDSANYGAPHFSDPSQFVSLSLSTCWRLYTGSPPTSLWKSLKHSDGKKKPTKISNKTAFFSRLELFTINVHFQTGHFFKWPAPKKQHTTIFWCYI